MSLTPLDNTDPNNVVIGTTAASAVEAVRDAPPVEPVEPAASATPAQRIGVADEGNAAPADLAEVSREARGLASDAIRAGTLDGVSMAAASPSTSLSSVALRELLRSFDEYDNGAARTTYNHYLNMFTRYSMTAEEAANEETAEMNLRALENSVYRRYGIASITNITRAVRKGMAMAIDRWFAGEGVFMPEMLHYTSVDGFSFSPLTQSALQALQAYDIRATYERERIAAYLRRMAALTPYDFVFGDPTGLGPLTLVRRREFLDIMDGILGNGDFSWRAADLRYAFAADGGLDFSLLQEQMAGERLRMQDYIAYQLNTYQGQLRESVRQYGGSIVSAAFG